MTIQFRHIVKTGLNTQKSTGNMKGVDLTQTQVKDLSPILCKKDPKSKMIIL